MLKNGALWRLEKGAAREVWEKLQEKLPNVHTLTLIDVFRAEVETFDEVKKAIWMEVADEVLAEYEANMERQRKIIVALNNGD